MLTISFGDAEWTAREALVKIFFSDFQGDWEDQGYVNELGEYALSIIEKGRCDAPKVLADQKESIRTLIRELSENENLPTIRKENWTAPPLIWLRFAFQALTHGIEPSRRFLQCYTRWRFERTLTNGLETIHQTGGVKHGGKARSFRIGDRKFEGYTLDDFLLNKNIRTDPGSKTKWELCVVPGLNDTQESASLNTPTKKSGKLTANETRDTRTIVGARAYTIIGECIDDAAQSGYPRRGLSKRKIDGRYKSSLSRPAFIAKLLKHYKEELPYAESTIRRAITDFVAFPNYRRSWGASRNDLTGNGPA